MISDKIKKDEAKISKSWQIKKLGDVCDLQNGFAFKSNDYIAKSETLIFRMSQIRPGGNLDLNHNSKYLPDDFVKKYNSYLLKEGDVIIAMTDMASETKILGLPTYFKSDGRNFLLNQRVGRLFDFDKKTIDLKYLRYILSSPNIIEYYKTFGKGALQINLGKSDILNAEIPIPPLSIQQLIVSKIESLFSELDKGIENLKLAQQQLKTYRQAVLKSAFEGKLTNKNVKEGELPKGWKIVTIEKVSAKITDGEHFRPQTQDSGIPFLSAKDVQDDGVSFEDPLYISEETAKKAFQRCNPQTGDILIVSRGATVGRMCIVNTNRQFCLLGSVILIKVNSNVDSKLLNYILKSPFVNQKMIAVSGATAQQAIYLRDIKNIPINLPPLDEQTKIVHEIESRLSVADKMEESIKQSLQQAEALRQSILKKAFEGRLV